MQLLAQDIATIKVQAFIRCEIFNLFKEIGLISQSQPLVPMSKRKRADLRVVKKNENDGSHDQQGANEVPTLPGPTPPST
jgi:hypothetical protein